MTAIYTGIENFFRYWDIYSEQPKLRTNGRSRFTSCCGLLLTLAFIATSIAVVAPVLRDYINGKYVEQVFKTDVANQNEELAQRLVTGRDIFFAVTVRRRDSTSQVDISDELKSSMSLTLGAIDLLSGTNLQLLDFEPCPPGYMSTFDNYVPMEYCYKPIDKVRLQLYNTDKYINVRFDSICRLGMICSGALVTAMQNRFSSFWFQHTFTVYFTTRYLDENNNVRFRIHMISSKQYYESNANSNIVVDYLTTTRYYIDDSVLPTRNNKTITLEDHTDKAIASLVSASTMQNYGVGAIFAQMNQEIIVYRYYVKLDAVVSIIGSCVFLFFVMYACLGYRINRYLYRQRIVESQYLQIENGAVRPASLNFCQQLFFLPYRLFNKVPNEPGNLSKYQNYYRSYYMATHHFTDVIEIIKKLNSIRRNLVRMGRTDWKSYVKKFKVPKYELGSQAVKAQDQKMIDLQEWSAEQFNDYQNLQKDARQNYIDSQESMKAIENPAEVSAGYNTLQRQTGSNYCQKVSRFFKKIDAFKVYPRFRANFESRSRLVGFCCLLFFALSILLWVTAFGFFVRSDARVSIQQMTIPVDRVNFTVKTGSAFMAALCVMDTTGYARNMDVQFNSYAAIELVQHYRVGSVKSQKTYPMSALGANYQSSFPDIFNLPDYTPNCYGLAKGINLTMQGSPSTQTQQYFSIRIRQDCKNDSIAYCNTYNAANRANTINIYAANTMRVIISDAKYDVVAQKFKSRYSNAVAFRNRATSCNSSVIDVVEVDQSVSFDDRSIHRDGGKEGASSIANEVTYAINSDIQPQNNDTVFYRMDFRFSGRVIKSSLVSPKGDEMFAMIGGTLLFVFFILGIFARPYREYNQRMQVAMMTDAVKDRKKPSSFQTFLYFTCFHGFVDWFKCKAPCLVVPRVFSNISSDNQSVENVTKSASTLHRLMARAMNKENPQYGLSDVYIKHSPQEQLVSGAAISNEHGLEQQLMNDESSNINSQLPAHQDLGIIKKGRKKNKKPVLDSSQMVARGNSEIQHNSSMNHLVQPSDNNAIDNLAPFGSDAFMRGQNSQSKGQREYVKMKTVVPRSNFCKKLLGPQSFLTNFLDFFGVQGELTVNGQARYGSIFGGILTLITTAIIIGTCYAFSDVYTGRHNYFSTRSYETQSSVLSDDIFVVGQDIRFALAFTSGNTPGLQDVESFVSGASAIMKLMLVEAQVNHTDRNNPVYKEVVHQLARCPQNYLNDGGRFQYVSYSSYQNISYAYCPPEGLALHLKGSFDSQIQKWFYLSVAMVCEGCNSTQLTSRRTTFANFFVNRTSRLYLSDPIIDDGPLRYDFSRIMFGRVVSIRSTVENISINTASIIEDKYLWQKPDVTRSLDYEYITATQLAYSYLDSVHIFRNLTFSPTYTRNLYVKTYIKFSQILAMIGGFSAFVWLVFRCCARRHNQGVMYMEIARSLYVERSQAFIRSADEKGINNYQQINFSEWDVLKYHTFGFFFEGVLSCTACRTSRQYALFKKTFNSIQGELDLTNNLKTINFATHVLSRQIFSIDGRLANLHLKEIVLPVREFKYPTKLNEQQVTKLKRFAELHQLTEHQLQKLVQSVGQVGIGSFQEQLGQPAELLDEMNMALKANKGRHRGHLEHLEHRPNMMNE